MFKSSLIFPGKARALCHIHKGWAFRLDLEYFLGNNALAYLAEVSVRTKNKVFITYPQIFYLSSLQGTWVQIPYSLARARRSFVALSVPEVPATTTTTTTPATTATCGACTDEGNFPNPNDLSNQGPML